MTLQMTWAIMQMIHLRKRRVIKSYCLMEVLFPFPWCLYHKCHLVYGTDIKKKSIGFNSRIQIINLRVFVCLVLVEVLNLHDYRVQTWFSTNTNHRYRFQSLSDPKIDSCSSWSDSSAPGIFQYPMTSLCLMSQCTGSSFLFSPYNTLKLSHKQRH